MSFLSCSTAGDLQPSEDEDNQTEQIIDDDIDEEISVDEEEIVDDYLTSCIIGKWKLMKVLVYTDIALKVDDYSKDNIIYEFKSNGILTISGVPKDNGGYRAGDHTYSVVPNPYFGASYRLIIDTFFIYGCKIANNELWFDILPLDGPAYFLNKIE